MEYSYNTVLTAVKNKKREKEKKRPMYKTGESQKQNECFRGILTIFT